MKDYDALVLYQFDNAEQMLDEMAPLIATSQLSDVAAQYDMADAKKIELRVPLVRDGKLLEGQLKDMEQKEAKMQANAYVPVGALKEVNEEAGLLKKQVDTLKTEVERVKGQARHYQKSYETAVSERSQLAVKNESLQRQVELLEEKVYQMQDEERRELLLRRRMDRHKTYGNLSELSEGRYRIVLSCLDGGR